MIGRLTDKVVIITGATSGIGKATALLFAEHGAQLVLTGRREQLGNDVRQQCEHRSARCVYVPADHTRTADCESVVAAALNEFGRIDVLFNNAGIVTRGTALTTDEALWHRTFEINVTAVWRMCRLAIEQMRKQGAGSIVNNGSDWSVVAGENALPYVMSKGAIASMTKAMALDHARDGIRVNAICPGDTLVDRWQAKFAEESPDDAAAAMARATAHIPMKRFATAQEIAQAALFLASDEASFITGHLLLVDGGNTAQ